MGMPRDCGGLAISVPTASANEDDEGAQRIYLDLHFDEVKVEIKHGGHGEQAEFSADSKDCGPALYREYST
jgi:hypothetical protein